MINKSTAVLAALTVAKTKREQIIKNTDICMYVQNRLNGERCEVANKNVNNKKKSAKKLSPICFAFGKFLEFPPNG